MKKLAKLRQFRDGMDVESYLTTELRQNWLALEQSLKSLGVKISSESSEDAENEDKSSGIDGAIVFTASKIGALSGGAVSLTLDLNCFILNEGGSWTGVAFKPKEAGTYAIEVGYLGTVTTESGGALVASIVQIIKSSTILNSASYSLRTASGAPIITGSGDAFAKAITTLTLSDTIYFNFVSIAPGGAASANNFYCEIKKIS